MRARILDPEKGRTVLTQHGEPVKLNLHLLESQSTPGRVRVALTVPTPIGEAVVSPFFRLEAN